MQKQFYDDDEQEFRTRFSQQPVIEKIQINNQIDENKLGQSDYYVQEQVDFRWINMLQQNIDQILSVSNNILIIDQKQLIDRQLGDLKNLSEIFNQYKDQADKASTVIELLQQEVSNNILQLTKQHKIIDNLAQENKIQNEQIQRLKFFEKQQQKDAKEIESKNTQLIELEQKYLRLNDENISLVNELRKYKIQQEELYKNYIDLQESQKALDSKLENQSDNKKNQDDEKKVQFLNKSLNNLVEVNIKLKNELGNIQKEKDQLQEDYLLCQEEKLSSASQLKQLQVLFDNLQQDQKERMSFQLQNNLQNEISYDLNGYQEDFNQYLQMRQTIMERISEKKLDYQFKNSIFRQDSKNLQMERITEKDENRQSNNQQNDVNSQFDFSNWNRHSQDSSQLIQQDISYIQEQDQSKINDQDNLNGEIQDLSQNSGNSSNKPSIMKQKVSVEVVQFDENQILNFDYAGILGVDIIIKQLKQKDEDILNNPTFSSNIELINQVNRQIQRNIIITMNGIYFLHPFTHQILQRIVLTQIKRVLCVDNDPCLFSIGFKNNQDYIMKSIHRKQIIRFLLDIFQKFNLELFERNFVKELIYTKKNDDQDQILDKFVNYKELMMNSNKIGKLESYKAGVFSSFWKEYMFFMTNIGLLQFYIQDGKLKQLIPLIGSKMVQENDSDGKFAFKLILLDKNQFLLRSNSHIDRDEWMKLLQQHQVDSQQNLQLSNYQLFQTN